MPYIVIIVGPLSQVGMAGQLTIIFWTLFILVTYVGIKYYQSRNRKLFFKEGIYRAFFWSIFIFVVPGMVITLVLPVEPYDLNFLQFHSEAVNGYVDDRNPLIRYLFQSLAVFSELHLLGLLSAGLILAIWVYYIRALDFFNQERIRPTIMVLLLGMLMSFFVFPISDLVYFIFDIEYSDNTFYNLFVYSFLGIGIVEELVKLVPILIVLNFTTEVDEPIDVIYYACISALGFAFIENLIYFRNVSGSIIIGRAVTSAVGHMINSSIVVYGIVLYRFNRGKRKKTVMLYYFLLGAFAHAFYDYLLFEGFLLFFYAVFIFFIQAWGIMINNAINNSRYFDYTVDYEHNRIKYRLAVYLAGLIMVGFLIDGLLAGRTDALQAYVASLAMSGPLIIFYVSGISSFDLFKGYWRPVKFSLGSPSDEAMPGMRGYSSLAGLFNENIIIPLNHVGKNIKLHSPTYNHPLCEIFHIGTGRIVARIGLKPDNGKMDIDWFLVKLATPLDFTGTYENDLILIKIRNKYDSLVHDEHIKCWLRLIPKGVDPRVDSDSSLFINYGFIMINGEDYQYKV